MGGNGSGDDSPFDTRACSCVFLCDCIFVLRGVANGLASAREGTEMDSESRATRARSLPLFLTGEKGLLVNSDVSVLTARDLCLDKVLDESWRGGVTARRSAGIGNGDVLEEAVAEEAACCLDSFL